MMRLLGCFLVGFAVFLAIVQADVAAGEVRAVTYSPHAAQYGCQMNMGPTGARAWMRGYHFVVVSVDQGSPAEGALEPLDVVIGADGTEFGPENDSRITLGNAIGRAEADGKPLRLTVFRDGDTRVVEVSLPHMGAYADTWPADCEKSRRILDLACRRLAQAQEPGGSIVTDGDMGTTLGGLLMLASEDPAYLDGARRAAYYIADTERDPEVRNSNWTMGYGGLLLAEYYLATGDDSVLDGLQAIVDYLCRGQMKSGGWGHSTPHGAYGTLNQVGVICAITLTLAKECGVEVDPEVLSRAHWFFGRFAGLGAVPYGDYFPSVTRLDANGRSASASILMRLAGQTEKADAYMQSVAESYWEREEGHTGGFFSMTWGSLAVSHASEELFRRFMDYQTWYYNLCRTWRGDLVLLPYYEALTRFDSSSYNFAGGDFTNGGFGLTFALPQKHLRILGAPESVFAVGVAPDGRLGTARDHYLDREWAACDNLLAGIVPETLKTERERRWFEQLKQARILSKAATERVLLEIDSNMVQDAPYRAYRQFAALRRCLGDDGDERFAKLLERLDAKGYHRSEGEKFYEAYKDMRVCTIKSWVPQGRLAKWMLEGTPSPYQAIWEPLSPSSKIEPQSWRTLLLPKEQELPEGWMRSDFDDAHWLKRDGIVTYHDAKEDEDLPEGTIAARREFVVDDPRGESLRVRLQTVRPARTKVYLNGTLIVDAVRGQRGGYAPIPLDPEAFNLLKTGRNLLAVTSTKQGQGGNHLDVALEINRIPAQERTLPTVRPEALVVEEAPDVDNTLRVRETNERMEQAIRDAYAEKTVGQLVSELDGPIAFYRHLAVEALVDKGKSGLTPVSELLSHESWRVRSEACAVLEQATKPEKRGADPDPEALALARRHIPALVALLDDSHHWVQMRALDALSRLGEPARVAMPRIRELICDEDPWVRLAALKAVRALHADPETAMAAAIEAIQQPNSAFSIPKHALGIFNEYPEMSKAEKLDAILAMFRDPPQGSGGRKCLHPLLELVVSLDPEGDQVIPFLTEAVAEEGDFSHQQANPRGKAISLLGQYGENARSAVPTLKKILASEKKADAKQHEAARAALEEITGEEIPPPATE